MVRRGLLTERTGYNGRGRHALALDPASRSVRTSVVLVVLAVLAAMFTVGISAVTSGSSARATTPTAASPKLAAAPAQGCGYADNSANNGTYAGTTCWLDFSAFNQTLARQPGGQPMQVTLQGGYVATFNATITDLPGAAPMTMTARSTPLETRFAFGTDAYRGVPGLDALYSDPGAFNVLKGATVSFNNIKVVDSAGAAVTGFGFVAADAEDNVQGESFTWTANKPLNVIETLAPNGDWGCKAPTGVGTTSMSCLGTGAGGSTTAGGKSTSLLVSADSPTSFATTWDTVSQSGIAIGIRTAKLTVNKQVVDRVNPTDSFDVSATSPQGTLLGSASTGTADTATTGGLTVLPQTGGGNYTLSETATAGSPAALSNYDAEWSCLNAATGSSTILPSGAGTSKTVVPAIGDDITCTVTNTARPPSLAVVKHAGTPVDVNGDGITDAGDTIQYTFTVTNTGPQPLGTIGVTDAKAGAVTCPDPTLAVGASETCTADTPYTITTADVTAGAVHNSASAQGTPPGSTTPVSSTPSTTSTPTVTPAPALTVVKSADPSSSADFTPGQKITYSFTATNTGNVPLNDVAINEGSFSGTGALSPATCPEPSLAVKAQEVCTATYTLTAADVDSGKVTNTATAQGTPPGSTTPVPSDPSTVTIPTPAHPGISVVKSASPKTVTRAGQTVKYSFVVTNTGNVTLSNVNVTDSDFSGTGTLSDMVCPATSLAAAQIETCSASYTVTQADVDAGSLTNTATAEGTPPGSAAPVTSDPSTTTVPVDQHPELSIVKTASPNDQNDYKVGEVLTYSFAITNTGDVTETNVAPNEGDFSGTGTLSLPVCPAAASSLAPGADVTCTATYTVTQADVDAGKITNAATATGTNPGGDPTGSNPSTAIVPTPQRPSLKLLKTSNLTKITTVGQAVTYSFKITNTGDVTEKKVHPTEGAFNGSGTLPRPTCPAAAASLAPGASVTCTAVYHVTSADLGTGQLSNTATAVGTAPNGDMTGSAPSTAKVTAADPPAKVTAADPPASTGLASTGSSLLGPTITGTGLLLLGALALLGAAILQRRRNGRAAGTDL